MGFFDDLVRVQKRFEKMHPDEQEAYRDVIAANPLNGLVLKESADKAEAWAKSLANFGTNAAGPGISIHNGPADAARHCYWSALLASKLPYNDAMRVVVTHEFGALESGKAQDKIEARMDLHNDRVGLEIGTRNKGATDTQLQDQCLEALFGGKLLVIDPTTSNLIPSKSLAPLR